MSTRDPRSPVLPAQPKGIPGAESRASHPNPKFAARLGERLRRLALGLTAVIVTVRSYWPSEPDLKVEAGSGLVWVLAVMVVAGLAVASGLVGGHLMLRFTWSDVAVIALMVLVGVSATRALDHRTAVNLAWQWGAVGIAYVLLRNLPRSRGETTAMAMALVATAVAVAAYGLYQVEVELEDVRELYRNKPDKALQMLGIAQGSPTQSAFENRLLGSSEPWSTFALANSLAGYLVGPLVLLLGVAWENWVLRDDLTTNDGRSSKGTALVIAAPVILLLIICIILTKSRSACVGFAVGAGMLLVRSRRRVRARSLAVASAVGLAAVGALVAAGLATGRLDRQAFTESTKSLRYRYEYWVGTWRLITDRPETFWTGIGPGNFGWAYVLYKLPQSSEEIQDPHNLILEVWVTAGAWGALALVTALTLALRNLLGPSSKRGENAEIREATRSPLPSRGADPPPLRTGRILCAAGAGLASMAFWSIVILFEVDLLMRWVVLGTAWLLAVAFLGRLWLRRSIPAASFGAAAMAMIVNLLASGGIGIPAVAIMLWALIAFGLNLRDDRPCSRLRDAVGPLPAFGLALAWAVLAGLFAGAAQTYWRADRDLSEAEAALQAKPPKLAQAHSAYLRAIEIDPFSARPWLGMAYEEYYGWTERGSSPHDRRWQKIPIALYEAVKPPRNPNAWTLHHQRALACRRLLELLGSKIGPKDRLRLKGSIVEASRKAAHLYPTSAVLRAALAEASAEIGKMDDAVHEAEEALRLDRITPHVDKKLPVTVRQRVEGILPKWKHAADAMKREPLTVPREK